MESMWIEVFGKKREQQLELAMCGKIEFCPQRKGKDGGDYHYGPNQNLFRGKCEIGRQKRTQLLNDFRHCNALNCGFARWGSF